MKAVSLLIAGLLLVSALFAASPAANSTSDATAAFARLKTLAGEWEATVEGKKAHLTYEVIAGGNSIVEHESMANMPEMLTVYYLDGNRLLLTHYCAAGNEPRLESKS